MLRNPVERSTIPSPEQIKALLQYIEEHPELAAGFPKLPAAKNKVKRQWVQLAPRLNSIGKSVKTWQQWTKFWADKKLAVNRKVALREAAVRSGSDPDMVVELSAVEQQILALACRARPAPAAAPATLACKASPSPEPPATTPSPSPSPPPAPSPPQGSCRSTRSSFKRAAASPPSLRCTGTKRRRGQSQPPPTEPSQRRSHLARLTEKFLSIEEQRLELERRNTSILETMAGVASQLMERDFERERVFAQALQTVGDGLRLLADALRKDEPIELILP